MIIMIDWYIIKLVVFHTCLSNKDVCFFRGVWFSEEKEKAPPELSEGFFFSYSFTTFRNAYNR